MTFLRNAWYMAAWTEEVTRAFLPRTVLAEPIVFYRREDGTPAAVADTCPHRFVPLSKGKLKGDVIECGYHGLQFDAAGRCVWNPHGDQKIPPALRIRSYPVVDRDEIVWIWMGDPAAPDLERLPRFEFFSRSDPGVRTVHNYLYSAFGADILIDNLLDLSRAEFLHDCTFSSGFAANNAMQVTEEGEGCVRVSRQLYDIPLPPPFAPIYDPGGNVDEYQETRWLAPGAVEFRNDVVRIGGRRGEGVWSLFNHYATPESERTTHYFFSISRRHRLEPSFDEAYRTRQLQGVELEDADMLEAQQRRMGDRDFWAMKPVLLQSDAAAMRVRRVMERLLKAEAALAQTPEVERVG
ncbi:MAG TPA: aromatic ring-hydroxylating dioxygenase subunit alpha [Hyphomicrobiales bacterium]|nr:aromatic ring-hydroxylating dioxygenase subunit alpha [Hyphomicrobiales bacterium]